MSPSPKIVTGTRRLDRGVARALTADGTSPQEARVTGFRTFLIADVRGYTVYTREKGDEAAAALAAAFAAAVRDVVATREGFLLELRGDEALVVFESPRQALRAAVELQTKFSEIELPRGVGIGLDAGEAIPVEGGYRGGALNLAARLCAQAGAGEILASETVIHLAARIDGVEYVDARTLRLKCRIGGLRLRFQPGAAVGPDARSVAALGRGCAAEPPAADLDAARALVGDRTGTTVRLAVTENCQDCASAAAVIVKNLAAIGLKVELVPLPDSYGAIREPNANYDLRVGATWPDLSDAGAFIDQMFASSLLADWLPDSVAGVRDVLRPLAGAERDAKATELANGLLAEEVPIAVCGYTVRGAYFGPTIGCVQFSPMGTLDLTALCPAS